MVSGSNDYDIETESRIKIENGTKFFSMGKLCIQTSIHKA